MNIEQKYGFILNQTIDFNNQDMIIKLMQNQGVDHPLIHGKDQPTCMKILHVRSFKLDDPNVWQKQILDQEHDDHDIDDLIYVNRCNTNLEWSWSDSYIAEIVRAEVEKLGDIYKALTRVTVLVTDINTEVPMHREFLYGNHYPSGAFPKPHHYFQNKRLSLSDYTPAELNVFHAQQEYYACKIPLTTIEGDNGLSVLQFAPNGPKYKYGAGNHMFCINEIDMLHGVLPTNFLRGVVYIDGQIDLEKLKASHYSNFNSLGVM